MKAKELQTKTVEELQAELSSLLRAQLNLRFQLKNGSLEQTDNIRKVRRDIARVNTVLSQKLKEQQAK